MQGRERASQGFRVHPVRLPGIVAVDAASDRRFARHSHDQFGIGLMVAGGQVSASGRGEVAAEAGQLITVNPGEVHDGRPLGEGRAWRMLYVDAGVIAGALAGLGRAPGGELHFPVLAAPGLAGAFSALRAQVLLGEAEAVRAGLMELLAPLVAQPDPPAALPVQVRHLRARIDAAPEAAVTLEVAAVEVGLSPWQLLRAFRRLTGLPPHAYRLQRQLHAARGHIAAGLPLAEAAAAAGFADQSHMTRHFGRAFGLTPGALAAAHRLN